MNHSSQTNLQVTKCLTSNSDEYIDIDVYVKRTDGSEFLQRMYVSTKNTGDLIRDEIRFSTSQSADFDEGGKVECPADVMAAFESSIPGVMNLIREASNEVEQQSV
jgi:hypothetical protein